MNVGCIGYCTEQGLGRLLLDFYRNGVVTHPLLWPHRVRTNHWEWYPPGTPAATRLSHGGGFDDYLKGLDVLLAFETPFDWDFFARAKAAKVKTVLVPMYEWTPKVWPVKPDAVICPSRLDYDYFKDEFPLARRRFLQVPVDPTTWEQRTTARQFLHNAGNVGHREHKGTRQLLEAIPLVKSEGFRITIRCQDPTAFPGCVGDPRVTYVMEEVPYVDLWAGFDAYVAPEKFNGLSLPLQEARAAGLLVVTTDRYPANEWLPRWPLIPVKEYCRASISRNYRDFDEAVVRPQDIARTLDLMMGTAIDDYSRQGHEWAKANSWSALKGAWLEELAR